MRTVLLMVVMIGAAIADTKEPTLIDRLDVQRSETLTFKATAETQLKEAVLPFLKQAETLVANADSLIKEVDEKGGSSELTKTVEAGLDKGSIERQKHAILILKAIMVILIEEITGEAVTDPMLIDSK